MECIPFSFACHDYSKYSADFQRQKLWFCRFSYRRFCQSFRSLFVHFYPVSLIAIFQPQNLPNHGSPLAHPAFFGRWCFFPFFPKFGHSPAPGFGLRGCKSARNRLFRPEKAQRGTRPHRRPFGASIAVRSPRRWKSKILLFYYGHLFLNLPCPFGQVGRFCGHAAGVSSVPSPLFTSPRVLPGSLVTPYGHSTSVGISSLSASTGWSASRKCSFSRAATASRSSA